MPVFDDVEQLIEHLEALGTTVSVEDDRLTELDHGLQTAALLERGRPDDIEIQVAGLVHDVAHPWDGAGQPRHAGMGADAVRPLLGDRVADLVDAHVEAKRFLVTVDRSYRDHLSPDSKLTLVAQGGGLDAEGVARFRRRPDWRAMVELRRADDRAKVPGAVVPGLDHWIGALRTLATAARRDIHADRT